MPIGRLLSTFALVGLCAFGGVMPWVYRALVEKRRWLDDREFAEIWGQAILIPGPTSTSVAATVGYRLSGYRGAAAAVLGLLAPPVLIALALAVVYQEYGTLPAVHGALRGLGAVSAGLVIATAIKLARKQPRRWSLPVFATSAFVAVFLLRLPLPLVVGALLIFALAVERRTKP